MIHFFYLTSLQHCFYNFKILPSLVVYIFFHDATLLEIFILSLLFVFIENGMCITDLFLCFVWMRNKKWDSKKWKERKNILFELEVKKIKIKRNE